MKHSNVFHKLGQFSLSGIAVLLMAGAAQGQTVKVTIDAPDTSVSVTAKKGETVLFNFKGWYCIHDDMLSDYSAIITGTKTTQYLENILFCDAAGGSDYDGIASCMGFEHKNYRQEMGNPLRSVSAPGKTTLSGCYTKTERNQALKIIAKAAQEALPR